MELHSYAKRRTPMKWTMEQKRKLVEARIAHDSWFANKPSSLVPWKNVLITANLVDFNVFFVRKQWSNMLERYKQYKQSRLGNIATKAIDAELIKRINQEWEFFEPIHKFMTRKTTNLHSYALTHRTDNNTNSEQQQKTAEELVQTTSTTLAEDEQQQQVNKSIAKLHNETKTINFQKDCAKENIPNNTTIVIQPNNMSQDGEDGIHSFSSDTEEEFQLAAGTTKVINVAARENKEEEEDENINCVRNTDHDFYSKKTTLGDTAVKVVRSQADDLQEHQSNYFADASEESQASTNMVVDVIQSHAQTNTISTPTITIRDMNDQMFEIKSETLTQSEIVDLKEEKQDQEFLNSMPSTSSTHGNVTLIVDNLPTSTSANRQSERDKYYRHKRHFNRRLEKRFDAILQVMSQIVQIEYPTVDVTPLFGAVTSVASNMGKMLSSDSEDDNQSDEIDNIPTTTNENK